MHNNGCGRDLSAGLKIISTGDPPKLTAILKIIKSTYIIVITKGYGARATTIRGQNAFAPSPCVSERERERVRENTRDQIAFCAFHSFLMEV